MKLGAQFYSLREKAITPDGVDNCFRAMKEIGYENVQISGICSIEAERLRDISQKYALPIVCTHSPLDRILNDTDALIAEHRIYGCPVIGLGWLDEKYRANRASLEAFVATIRKPIEKIRDAGLRFAYHNHAFEFDVMDYGKLYDYFIENLPQVDFILDTYWVRYAGENVLDYIEKIGSSRMSCVHFKDMKSEPKGPICACGEGVTDFRPIIALCDRLGIPNALVEQDNAPDSGDEFGQMKISYDHLRPLM